MTRLRFGEEDLTWEQTPNGFVARDREGVVQVVYETGMVPEDHEVVLGMTDRHAILSLLAIPPHTPKAGAALNAVRHLVADFKGTLTMSPRGPQIGRPRPGETPHVWAQELALGVRNVWRQFTGEEPRIPRKRSSDSTRDVPWVAFVERVFRIAGAPGNGRGYAHKIAKNVPKRPRG